MVPVECKSGFGIGRVGSHKHFHLLLVQFTVMIQIVDFHEGIDFVRGKRLGNLGFCGCRQHGWFNGAKCDYEENYYE